MIGTLTFHWATNYGAVIQAYALQKAIEDIGLETEIIDYSPRRLVLNRLFMSVKRGDIDQIKKEIKLSDFRKKHLHLSKKRYGNNRQLYTLKDKYTHIVVGSDQVWNYSFTMTAEKRTTLSYFINFAGNDTKRISYAASFGSDNEPEDYIQVVSPFIQRFDAISVREITGIDIVKKLGSDACQVCDPTALLTRDDYNALIDLNIAKDDYIYVYMLHNEHNNAIKIIDYVSSNYNISNVKTEKSEDLLSWLRNIRDSKFVITNSFHGLMFSLIFNRPFIIIPVNGNKMSSRISTILNYVGANNRIVSSDYSNIEEIINSDLDWGRINAKLNELRRIGIQFIKDSLN